MVTYVSDYGYFEHDSSSIFLETIQLLSRIEKSIATAKPSVKRSPPSSRGVRELRRLQFGVNYERPSSSSSGLKVFNG